MKHKRILGLIIIMVIGVSIFSILHPINASAAQPILSIVLSGTTSTTNIQTMSVGSTFNLDIRLDNTGSVTNGINGATYTICWNPTVLNLTSTKNNSLFWGSKIQSINTAYNSSAFIFNQIIQDTSNASATALASSGILATATFQVLAKGQSNIVFDQSANNLLYVTSPDPNSNTGADNLPVSVVDATYGGAAPTVYGPTANFTPADGSIFALGSSVKLNASASQPGYDKQTCNITNYAWSVEYLNGTTFASLNGEIATFNPSVQGAFRVILIVTAPDPTSPSDPNFQPTDSTSAVIYVVSVPGGVKIDVFTDKGGLGPNASSGAYSPLQTLQMYASLSTATGSTSMAEQNVIFTIQNSNGSIILVRQAITNQTGIASSGFTLPAPDPTSPQTTFGTWTLTATFNVVSVTINDTASFDFSYQSYLSGIQKIQLPSSVPCLGTLPIQITVNNSYYPAQWTEACITVFDQAGEPIGSSTITTSQTQTITLISSDITIPSWAFTGPATVYVCLLTNSTNSQLAPLSPEASASFNITA